MNYQFFEALTGQVERLVSRLSAERPDCFRYRQWDFARVFARSVYILGSSDPALYSLYAEEAKLPSEGSDTLLGSDLAYLLAKEWFGRRADRFAPGHFPAARLVRPARLLLGRRISLSISRPAAKYDVLLFAATIRFARFLEPVARQLGDCAFLVREGDSALRRWLAERNLAAVTVPDAGPGLRSAGPVLARFIPGALLAAEEFDDVLRKVRPSVVVLPEGNAPDDEILGQVGASLGIAVACLQQGWSPLIHTCFRGMRFASMMVWGEGFADMLRSENPHQLFCAVGNYQVALSGPAVRAGIAFFGVGANGWLEAGDEARLLSLAARLAAALPDVPVYFRPHPRDPIDEMLLRPLRALPNVTFCDPGEPLADLLGRVRVGVSIYSSTILETAASGAVPMIFNTTTMPHYWPDIAAEGAGVELRSQDDAFEMLCRLMAPGGTEAFSMSLTAFRQRYFADYGAGALSRIAAEIRRLAVP